MIKKKLFSSKKILLSLVLLVSLSACSVDAETKELLNSEVPSSSENIKDWDFNLTETLSLPDKEPVQSTIKQTGVNVWEVQEYHTEESSNYTLTLKEDNKIYSSDGSIFTEAEKHTEDTIPEMYSMPYGIIFSSTFWDTSNPQTLKENIERFLLPLVNSENEITRDAMVEAHRLYQVYLYKGEVPEDATMLNEESMPDFYADLTKAGNAKVNVTYEDDKLKTFNMKFPQIEVNVSW